jgi:hypothetical protein
MTRETDCPACHGKFAALFAAQLGPGRSPEKPVWVDCSRCGRRWVVLYAESPMGSEETVYMLGDELKDR